MMTSTAFAVVTIRSANTMKPTDYEKDTTPPPDPQADKIIQEVVKEAWKQEKTDEQAH
jgi:hypothetical protein